MRVSYMKAADPKEQTEAIEKKIDNQYINKWFILK